ncbi:PREDICTED: GRIP and coiled-coil domain-containing protein 2-like [Papilio xuthus]|uniref:GRIP and coiled-coil domain-containing protein 2-like n=1 Tax=Papilio xuthus TaxID=66420 RepID=A0AAJ6ZE68_PAPXU|nr:PREDICTED: GRIP and coiled-coil domain-containing protein 2-like [Papilio xuthus]
MACNSCFKAFSIFRQEKGCPNCGFSFCSKCLNYKMFVKKLNEERKVCLKCSRLSMNKPDKARVIPTDAYNRNALSKDNTSTSKQNDNVETNRIDEEIKERLNKLKQTASSNTEVSNKDIAERLQKLKEDSVSSNDVKLHPSLTTAGGSSVTVLNVKKKRSEQEEVNDLLVELEEKSKIDTKYSKDFENKLSEIEMRLQKLRSSNTNTDIVEQTLKRNIPDNEQTAPSQILGKPIKTEQEELNDLLKELEEESKIEAQYCDDFVMKLNDLEKRLNNLKKTQPSTDEDVQKLKNNNDEQTVLRQILEKIQMDVSNKDTEGISPDLNDELPFCEICNEDAKVRCKGCKYLFCIRCFIEHKDEDCNEYEIYNAPK